MHVSVRTLYALRALSAMGESEPDQPVHARELAGRLGMSKDYLNQILGTLRDAGLVATKKGPHGGFRLAKPPDEITLGDVIEILEGPALVSDCTKPDKSDCEIIPECATQSILADVSTNIMDYLHSITINDINEESDLPAVNASS